MTLRWRVIFAALCVACSLGAVLSSPSALSATGGDFIIRCFFNGKIAAMDPIIDPGGSTTEHLHIFFGNMIQGTTSFPTIKSGDSGGSGTMENNGLAPRTNCQDSSDTAGYWVPEPYLNGLPWHPGDGCSTACDPAKDLYLRVYYLPTVSGMQHVIPDGSIMVAGYPDGCHQFSGLPLPDGCAASGNPSYPTDTSIVRYTCGADNNLNIRTPASSWPYDCSNYKDPDDAFNDGIVAFTDFPECWNNHKDWSPPNDPAGPKVAGYVAPWIPYADAPVDLSGNRLNDFAYPTNGMCPSGFKIIVAQLEERMHLLTMGTGFGEPSTCSEEGKNWNTPADNAEWTDGDGHPTHTCVPASAPSSSISLSFACSHSGDPNCTVDTGQTGCGSGTGHCFIGASPHGWETLHADYWQTWQQGGGTDVFPEKSQGAFDDLIEDCSNGMGGACSFVTNVSPSPLVYGNPEIPG
jgi:hypothetical protein